MSAALVHVLDISHFHFQFFSSRSRAEYIQHPNRRIYVDATCFFGRASISSHAHWDPCRASNPRGTLFLQIPCWVFNVRFRFQVDLMRQNNAQRVGEKLFCFPLPNFVAQLNNIPMHPTTCAEHASLQSPRANFWHCNLSLTFLTLGVFGLVHGIFAYHAFAVQLAPWFASLV